MTSGEMSFDYTSLLRKGLPTPSPRWKGLPKYPFIGGHNDPDLIPAEALAEAAAAVLRRNASRLAIYNLGHGFQGFEGLRDVLADKLRRARGMTCTRDDIMITSGSAQGIELVNQLFVDRGDTVIVEELTFQGALSQLRRLGAKIIGAPLDEGGLRIDALAAILDDLRRKGVGPKYIYTIPTVQNPTGSILSLERREALLRLAREHGVPIFEDECYADITWSDDVPPALYALDPKRVIHIGSLSKTLAPALRIGYVAADWPVLSQMMAMRTDGGTGAIDQLVAAEYFGPNHEAHIGKLASSLKSKLDTMVDAVQQAFGTSVEMWVPKGGIFLWLKLPEHIDVRKLMKPASDADLAFNPGPEWACDQQAAKSSMRLCFALPTHREITDGIAELARVCFEHTGIPERSANVARR